MADVPLAKSPLPLDQLAGADTATDGQVPTSDGAGAVAWETPAGGGGGGAGTVGGPPSVKYKTANESVTSSITLQDDNDLVQAIGASETWIVEFTLFVSGEDAGDILIDVAAPASATGLQGLVAPALASTTDTGSVRNRAYATLSTGGVGVGIIDSIMTIVEVRATVFNSTNAGDIKLRWAQATSNATATVVNAGSYLKAYRVA